MHQLTLLLIQIDIFSLGSPTVNLQSHFAPVPEIWTHQSLTTLYQYISLHKKLNVGYPANHGKNQNRISCMNPNRKDGVFSSFLQLFFSGSDHVTCPRFTHQPVLPSHLASSNSQVYVQYGRLGSR